MGDGFGEGCEPAQSHREIRLRRGQQRFRRQCFAACGRGKPADLDRGRKRDRGKFRARRADESRPLRCCYRCDDGNHEGRPGGAAFPARARRIKTRLRLFDSDADRRPVLARSHERRGAAVDPQQRRTFRAAQPDRPGRNSLQKFRWQNGPGVVATAARLRQDEKISAHPEHSRRSAHGLRIRFRPRVSVDGGEGLHRALSEPAREHELRPGVRQRDPVSLSRRRFQRPHDRRG